MAKEKKLVITQVRSTIGQPESFRRTLRALGLKGHQQRVEQRDTPAIRGMIEHVRHFVTVEDA